ncbi:MAG: MarC family protein [Halioglobus sp.]|nr:MarC family protein [Halioglobus sp.]
MDWDIALKEFITLWVVIDPIGTIPVFLAVTAGLSVAQQRSIAVKSTLIAGLILLFFIVGGQVLMEGLNIHLESFQIAGGIILFLFATTMIFGDGKPASEQKQFDGNISHLAVFPLAIPSLASPGAMLSVVMLTDNHRYSIEQQAVTAGIMVTVMLCTAALLLLANPIQRVIGTAGASIISRVMGLILASVAVDNILHALNTYFQLGL